MAEVTIKASEDGPFLVKGPVKVVDGEEAGVGAGRTKKDAEQAAAQRALEALG